MLHVMLRVDRHAAIDMPMMLNLISVKLLSFERRVQSLPVLHHPAVTIWILAPSELEFFWLVIFSEFIFEQDVSLATLEVLIGSLRQVSCARGQLSGALW